MSTVQFPYTPPSPPEHEPPEPAAARGGWRRKFLVAAVPMAVIAAGVVGCVTLVQTGPKAEKTDEGPRPLAVQFATAESRTTEIALSLQGEVRPRTQATLAAQVSGRVVWVSEAFAEGAAFRRGQTLVRLDPADAELAVVRARAQVAQAEEGLAREEAEAALAQRDWEELGQGEASALVLREPQLAQARAALASARAQLHSAELDLSRTAVVAPFDGRVMRRAVNLGDFVGPGGPVAEVFATDAMEIRVPFTDADLAALGLTVGYVAQSAAAAPEAHVSAVVAGEPRQWAGRLVRIEAAVEASTRLIYGVVQVAEPFASRYPAPLAPGLFASVDVDALENRTLVAAPRSALKRNAFLYVIEADDTISIREVRPQHTTATHAYFAAGVAPGERVVVSALPSPRAGMPVTPMAAGAGGPPADATP